jgi:hypothetical protein
MKNKLCPWAFGIVLIASLVGCTPGPGSSISLTGSGNVITLEKDYTDFDGVAVSHSFKVDIRQGEAFSVVIRIDDNLEKYLEVIKEDGTLKIGFKPDRSYDIGEVTTEAAVTMPELTGVSLSFISHGTVTGFSSTQALDVNVSGVSSLSGDIEAGDASFNISGGSQVTLNGSAEDVSINASGSSELDLTMFPADDADVHTSGSSQVTVHASGRLDAEASGSSRIYYLGDPTLGRTHTSGSASIERK